MSFTKHSRAFVEAIAFSPSRMKGSSSKGLRHELPSVSPFRDPAADHDDQLVAAGNRARASRIPKLNAFRQRRKVA